MFLSALIDVCKAEACLEKKELNSEEISSKLNNAQKYYQKALAELQVKINKFNFFPKLNYNNFLGIIMSEGTPKVSMQIY